jgi:hypothetical protein
VRTQDTHHTNETAEQYQKRDNRHHSEKRDPQ